MSTRSIRLITTQKVLKTWSVKGVNQHYLGSNHTGKGNSCIACTLYLANLSFSLTLHFYELGRKSLLYFFFILVFVLDQLVKPIILIIFLRLG